VATESVIIPHLVLDRLKRGAGGALVSFIGMVRPLSSGGEKVPFIECGGDKDTVEQELWDVAA